MKIQAYLVVLLLAVAVPTGVVAQDRPWWRAVADPPRVQTWRAVAPRGQANRARPVSRSLEDKVGDLRALRLRRKKLQQLMAEPNSLFESKSVPDEIMQLIFGYVGYDTVL